MKLTFFKNFILILSVLLSACDSSRETEGGALTPVPFSMVKMKDDFWKPRLDTQLETLVPFALDKTIPAVENLQKAAKYLKGDTTDLPFTHRYVSSDLYKVMEGAAYLLQEHSVPELEQRMDRIIDIIGEAQQKDGYLYVSHITGVSKNDVKGMGERPYSFVVHSHELYNMGHMYEGAIAYYQATGKDKWLKIAEKNAQHINKVFFEGDPAYNGGEPVNQAPGHEELEIALTKLYRVTGNELYLEMAKKFLDIRGTTYKPGGEGTMSDEYAQQHKPVTDQRHAVGHAVRATYLYSGMSDVAALTDTHKYDTALQSIWHDITDTKISITGGLGAVHGIEGFGPAYLLPNKEAYNETCSAVGNVLFNFRMYLMSGDGQFMDIAEVSLLNNSLAGVNMEGNKFFYVNPLEADGKTPFNHGTPGRSPWFGTACCPSNIARLIPQVAGMMYAYRSDEIYIGFYASSETEIPLKGGIVKLEQHSNYPFDGNVKLLVNPEREQQFRLKFRIPTWAGSEQFMPGGLYDYVDGQASTWEVKVNNEVIKAEIENGFATIDRVWKPDDQVELSISMPIHFNKSINKVEANRNRLAVTRGPLVYAAEGIDNNGPVQSFYFKDIPSKNEVGESKIKEGVLSNVVTVSVPAQKLGQGSTTLEMIPYYSWNNRGNGSMVVWVPTEKEIATSSMNELNRGEEYAEVSVSTSHQRSSIEGLQNPSRPESSRGGTSRPWIGADDQDQWVEIALDKPRKIRSIGVYWMAARDFVFPPESWRIQYETNGKWKDLNIYVTDSYSTDLDEYNVVHPSESLSTQKIRVVLQPQEGKLAGIRDVDISYEGSMN